MELVVEKYKRTEVGLIPSDWEVKELGQCLIKNPDYGINAAAVDYDDTLPRYLRITDISEAGKYLQLNKASVNHTLSNLYYLEEGDIVFARTGASVGKTYLYDVNDGKLVFAGFLIRVKSNPEILNPKYLIYLTQTKSYWAWVTANSMRSGQPGLNSNEFKSFKIPITLLSEQTLIATALSDADALISSLEKLIAKKRNIKQGAMQKLLQPKEGWEVKKLGEVGKPFGGLSGKSKLDFADGKFPYIPFMNIMSNPIIDTAYFDYVNIGESESQNKALKGDLFFNGSSETPEEVGMCSVLLEDIPNLYLNSFCFGFRLNRDSKENGLYLSYYFRSSEGRKLFYSMAQGATRYNLSKSNFNKLQVSLPKPEEQIEISNILTDMNQEITALETKLEKYKKVKLGMMQNLLTGKIRLV